MLRHAGSTLVAVLVLGGLAGCAAGDPTDGGDGDGAQAALATDDALAASVCGTGLFKIDTLAPKSIGGAAITYSILGFVKEVNGKPVGYDGVGRPTKINGKTIGYSWFGPLSKIDGETVGFDFIGRVSKIDGIEVGYDNLGQLTKIKDRVVAYDKLGFGSKLDGVPTEYGAGFVTARSRATLCLVLYTSSPRTGSK